MLKKEFIKKFRKEIESIKSSKNKTDFRNNLRILQNKAEKFKLNVLAWDFVSSNFDRILTVKKENVYFGCVVG